METAEYKESKRAYDRTPARKAQVVRRKYGASTSKEAMWEAQKGICPICLELLPFDQLHSRKIHVDHNHALPKGKGNRGLLHGRCNVFIVGPCENYPEEVRRAFIYLRQSTPGRNPLT